MATGNRTLLVPQPLVGETRHGSHNATDAQGVLYVRSAIALKASVLALDAVAADGTITTFYLWFQSTGQLRGSATFPTNTETSGSTIGSPVT